MICERCYRPTDVGDHGHMLCPLERRRGAVVWTDDIPGGVDIANGICNADGTPKRYYSKSAIKAALEAKGMIPYHEVYQEQGNSTIKAGHDYTAWHKSDEYKRIKRHAVEERREKAHR
jgi:hypothetical protein